MGKAGNTNTERNKTYLIFWAESQKKNKKKLKTNPPFPSPLSTRNRQISTYDADFTLLPECDLERALVCLSSKFSISNNPLEDVGLQSSDLQTWEKSYPMSPLGVNSLQEALSLNPAVRDRQLSVGTDSGIASAAATAPNSDASGHPGKSNEPSDLVDPALISSLSLNDPDQEPVCSRENVVRARHPFKVDFPHRLHITSMEQSLMDVLAIRLLESIFFDNRYHSLPGREYNSTYWNCAN